MWQHLIFCSALSARRLSSSRGGEPLFSLAAAEGRKEKAPPPPPPWSVVLSGVAVSPSQLGGVAFVAFPSLLRFAGGGARRRQTRMTRMIKDGLGAGLCERMRLCQDGGGITCTSRWSTGREEIIQVKNRDYNSFGIVLCCLANAKRSEDKCSMFYLLWWKTIEA